MFNSPAFVVYYLSALSLNARYNNIMSLRSLSAIRSGCTHSAPSPQASDGEVNLLENEKPNELRTIHPTNEPKYFPFPKFPVL